MGELIDISVRLGPQTPVWPGSDRAALTRVRDLARGDSHTASLLSMDVHTGTHVDAPMHFLDGGAPTEALSLDTLVGPAAVIDFGAHPVITAELLEERVPVGVERLLCRTANSRWWSRGDPAFHEDFVAWTPEAAAWAARRGLQLVGVDYLSVQRFGDDDATHRTLLAAGIVILEGLDLSDVTPGDYELICLPLRLVDAEGAPARAVLRALAPTRSR